MRRNCAKCCGPVLLVLVLASCEPEGSQSKLVIDTAAFGMSSHPPKSKAPTPDEIAQLRGTRVSDQIDTLLAKVLGMDAEFGEGESKDVSFFVFSGRNNSAFKRLAVIPAAVPRLVECLGWNRRSRTTWNGVPVLAGAVCGHVLRATPYYQTRNHPPRWQGFEESGWIGYRNPTIENLRAVQKQWLGQLRRDPN